MFVEWLRLVNAYKILGKQVHDARLIALLNVHEVPHLLTFNVGDFQRFGAIAISPEQVV
ncbi:MAG: hypothetical protein ACOY3P_02610 [Planctomycetota bacterium]